jgi:hypothetical protein
MEREQLIPALYLLKSAKIIEALFLMVGTTIPTVQSQNLMAVVDIKIPSIFLLISQKQLPVLWQMQ